MLWLAEQGHQVIGVELSPVAVKAFFDDNALPVTKHRAGNFTHWKSGRITILCGDYFALTADDIGIIDAIYDRAALTALPDDIRLLYITHQKKLVVPAGTIFLLTIEDTVQDWRSKNHAPVCCQRRPGHCAGVGPETSVTTATTAPAATAVSAVA